MPIDLQSATSTLNVYRHCLDVVDVSGRQKRLCTKFKYVWVGNIVILNPDNNHIPGFATFLLSSLNPARVAAPELSFPVNFPRFTTRSFSLTEKVMKNEMKIPYKVKNNHAKPLQFYTGCYKKSNIFYTFSHFESGLM